MPEQLQNLSFTAPIELQAGADSKPVKASILAYTGDVMTISGFGAVVVDLAGMEIPASLPLLADHESSLHNIIGQAVPVIRSGKLLAEGTLTDATDSGRTVIMLAKGGIKFQASIGAQPQERRFIREKEAVNVNGRQLTAGPGGFALITKSVLKEISILAIGADSETAVKIAAKGTQTMPQENTQSSATPSLMTAERERIDALEAVALQAIRRSPAQRVAIDMMLNAAISDGSTDAPAFDLALVRGLRPQAPVNASLSSTGAPAGAPRELLAGAILGLTSQRGNIEKMFGAEVAQAAGNLRCGSLIDVCRAALQLEHRDVPRAQTDMIRAAFSTTSLPVALGLSAEKSMLSAFNAVPATWRSIARTMNVRNFKENTALRAYLKDGSLEEVGGDGEIKHAAILEETFTHQAKTWARMFTVTRTSTIDDDLGVFDELSIELGRQGSRKISDEVWRVVLSNPSSFFHNDNSNLLTGGSSPLSIDSYGAAVRKLREQTDADSKPIDLSPFALVVPPALEATGRQILSSVSLSRDETEDSLPIGNPWMQSAKLEVEPRITTATQWYLSANPANVAPFMVSFLNGKESPTVEIAELPSNVLGSGFRAYIDFGADAGDPRGAVRSDGA